ncbi:MAG: hypothetical protein GF311_03810 [Candidatus Lokiarchaeota archaeon]|nr:hypothetical protein [Candidatus Lokiarchaeota archaeon]
MNQNANAIVSKKNIFTFYFKINMEATGIQFGIIPIKSADPKINLKGKSLSAFLVYNEVKEMSFSL